MSESTLKLHYHPYSRAANVVWMLEELGRPYERVFCDLMAGEQRTPAYREINPMGKLPALVDGDVVVTEVAAIGLYLADRYALGRLAPALDDPARATYLRWSVYPSAVIEPGCMAHSAEWPFKPGNAGWGDYPTMLDTIEAAIGQGPWLLGEPFTLADITFGGTLGWMLRFKMIEARPTFVDYVARLAERPAAKAAQAIHAATREEHGLSG